MSDQDRKAALKESVDYWVSGSPTVKDYALKAIERHIEAAYKAGLKAGRSQAGYRTTRRKRKESSCPSPSAPSAPESAASADDA